MDNVLLYIVLALAIARLTLILVRDDIADPLRRFVFKHSPPEQLEINGRYDKNPDFDENKPVGEGNYPTIWKTDIVRAKWWGQVFSCPDCMCPYVATAYLTAYYFFPQEVLLTGYVLAASMITSLIARRY